MTDDDLDLAGDLTAAVLYRMAYGAARDALERDRFAGRDGRRIDPDDVARRIGPGIGADEGLRSAIVRAAVEDAHAGRRPRW